jgi:hypothetical protein
VNRDKTYRDVLEVTTQITGFIMNILMVLKILIPNEINRNLILDTTNLILGLFISILAYMSKKYRSQVLENSYENYIQKANKVLGILENNIIQGLTSKEDFNTLMKNNILNNMTEDILTEQPQISISDINMALEEYTKQKEKTK